MILPSVMMLISYFTFAGSDVPEIGGADFCWAIKLGSIGRFDIRFRTLFMFGGQNAG
jgi:hypothetical protein